MKLFNNKFFLVAAAFLIGALFSYSMISLEGAKSSHQGSTQIIQKVTPQRSKPRVTRRRNLDDINARQQKIMNKMMKVFDQSLSMDMDTNSFEVTKYSDSEYRYVKVMAGDIDESTLM